MLRGMPGMGFSAAERRLCDLRHIAGGVAVVRSRTASVPCRRGPCSAAWARTMTGWHGGRPLASMSGFRATRNSHGRAGRSPERNCGRCRQARMNVSGTMSSAPAVGGKRNDEHNYYHG